ncbi:hydroxysqualene dehydroxylase HpnE [Piscinibacter sp.]|uniref:hydroxysqualene dehydroxylase HpnE n=1 Tax=Piscinibacter sp. TaxID=1903157 RepID=UPI002F421ED5
MTGRSVAVVGGGWAGLAAAIEARQRGHAVTLYEMAPQLGGRARRVDLDGIALDNGQHILIGAYRETLRLIRAVGVDPAVAFVRTPLRLVYPDGHGLQLPPGSPMWAFARGVMRLRAWRLGDRLALLATAAAWMWRGFRCDASLTVAQLTSNLPHAVRADLVDPLCVAALNTPSQTASAAVFLRVIRDALFSGPGSADLLLPTLRLTELFPGPAAHWLERSGVAVERSHRVDALKADAGRWCVDGTPFDQVVVATSAAEAARLIEPIEPGWSAMAATLRYEPIITVYAQCDGVRLAQPMLALRSDDAHSPAQFVFDLGQLGGPDGLLGFVISGAQAWVDRGADATCTAVLNQARQMLGRQLRQPLRVQRLLTEKRATFRCTPGLQRPPGSIAPRLHAAGDYVAGPYPATLEGAVRSGVDAVRSIV